MNSNTATLTGNMQTEDQLVSSTGKISRTTRFLWNLVLRGLNQLEHGTVTIVDSCETITLGSPDSDRLNSTLMILDESFYKDVILHGNLGVAEAYLQGKWRCDDLTSLIRIFCRNLDQSTKLDRGIGRIALQFAKAAHQLSRNSLSGSRRNIAAHYDLSNDFFQLFLDPTMMYSSAYFANSETTLEQASQAKLDLICRKLDLQPSDRVLEIGTGWGGLALHATQNYGCHVTTTTISGQQHHLAQQRFAEAGINDRVELLQTDYRELTGQYDKIVSIEMIEAVGQQYLDTYFAKCHELLKPGGELLIQAITIPDQRYSDYCRSVDFIQRYIFPGGHLPSIGAMQKSASVNQQFRLTDLEDFGHSYALTLREWRHRFFEKIDEVRKLGFDERFIRMWEYYLCYCEGAFLEQAVGVSHLQWQKAKY